MNPQGRTETDLEKLSTSAVKARFIRPGYFFPRLPEDRKHQRSLIARAFDSLFAPIRKIVPKMMIPVEVLGQSSLEVAKGSFPDEKVFRNARLREMTKDQL
jgi:hypothetical protein